MAASTFFIPSSNVIDAGSLIETMNTMVERRLRHTFIATDDKSKKSGMTEIFRMHFRHSIFQRYL
ncbi:hypothetical protein ABK730_20550 [Klebsiella indica]|uniref:hypothetical protein n=1 Tax=Klebsiella TaxID=570 RepID=UPI001106A4AE|nr:hypothetical protein [Klebsiella sp. 2680]